jgi:hypothetical protein
MLTTTQIKNLKVGILTDVGPYRGLRLSATLAGKSWIFRYKNFEGKIKQLKLGIFPSLSLADAREEIAQYKQMRLKGTDPQQHRQQAIEKSIAEANKAKWEQHKSTYLIEDMVKHYIEEHVDKRRNFKGSKEARRLMERDALPVIGQIAAAELKRSHLHNLVVRLAPSIARDVKREMRAAFEHGIAAGRIPEELRNPVSRLCIILCRIVECLSRNC